MGDACVPSIFLASFFLILDSISFGQAPDQKSTFKVTTRLVQVDVVVHDKNGKPIEDLAKEDFVLYDEGKVQQISTFSKVTDKPVETDLAPLSPGVFSNRFTNSKGPEPARIIARPNVTNVFLIDYMNSEYFEDTHFGHDAVVKFLQQTQPGDQVAIYVLSNGLHILHDLSSDTASLLAALNNQERQVSFLGEASLYTDFAKNSAYFNGLLSNPNFSAHRGAETGMITSIAILNIANHLSGISGRKNLIWLTSHCMADLSIVKGKFSKTLSAVNDAGVAIYPIDNRGLIGQFRYDPQNTGNLNLSIWNSHNDMKEVAENTGGQASLNTNDLSGSIRKVLEDTRVVYTLGFTPTNEVWDGKFRKIKIKINRPGAEGRNSRQGYYAVAAPDNTEIDRQKVLGYTLQSPLLDTGLGILAKISAKPTQERPQTTISVVLDARELVFNANGRGEPEANLDMLAAVFDAQRQSLKQIERIVSLSNKPMQFTPAMSTGIKLEVDIETPEKSDHIRLVFRDKASGATGSIDVPIK
jgi:VWFA-related protein